jgi:hypothetical protein
MLGDYKGEDNYGRPKVDYITKIGNMAYDELMKETKGKIWLSAYADNNPRSDYHWQCDACYDEWVKREGNNRSYSVAWSQVSESV